MVQGVIWKVKTCMLNEKLARSYICYWPVWRLVWLLPVVYKKLVYSPIQFRFFFFIYPVGIFSVFFRHIVKTEGPKALFKGLVPNIVGVAPSRAIYFGAYAQSKKFFNTVLNPDTPIVHVLSASFAGKNRFCVWCIYSTCEKVNVWIKLIKCKKIIKYIFLVYLSDVYFVSLSSFCLKNAK